MPQQFILDPEKTAIEGKGVFLRLSKYGTSRRYIRGKKGNLMSYSRYLWLKHNPGKMLSIHEDIHHKDLNALNDSMENLIKIRKGPHRTLHNLIKTLFPVIMLSIMPLIAGAYSSGEYRDSEGGYAGSWEGDASYRTYKGPDGNYVGSAERDGDGWTFKDDEGGYAGSSTGDSDRNPFVNDED